MNKELFRQAAELEGSDPRKALACYELLEKENRKYNKDIFFIAYICPLLASVLAYFICRDIERYQELLAVIIVAGLGFFPAILIFLYRVQKQGFEHPGRIPMFLYAAISVFFFMLGPAFAVAIDVLIAAFFAAIILIPIGLIIHFVADTPSFLSIDSFPLYISLPVFVPIFLLVTLQSLSEVRIIPIFPLKRFLIEIPVGLRLNLKKVLLLFAALGIGLALAGSGPLGLIHENIIGAAAANTFAGIILGLSIYVMEADFVLANFIRLGQVRSLIVLKRTVEASIRLKMISQSPRFSRHDNVEFLAQVLWAIRHSQTSASAIQQLQEIAEMDYPIDRYRYIWLINYSRTRRLAGLKESPGEVQPDVQSDRAKYTGIGRVLASGYSYQEGVRKREYDENNLTGYMTGQWIDVEVVDGVMEFNGFHSQGEIIRGVWSYGGDVGIVGKPKVGDLVGYYREAYCQVWEKVVPG